jgi:hypothetical protein
MLAKIASPIDLDATNGETTAPGLALILAETRDEPDDRGSCWHLIPSVDQASNRKPPPELTGELG